MEFHSPLPVAVGSPNDCQQPPPLGSVGLTRRETLNVTVLGTAQQQHDFIDSAKLQHQTSVEADVHFDSKHEPVREWNEHLLPTRTHRRSCEHRDAIRR